MGIGLGGQKLHQELAQESGDPDSQDRPGKTSRTPSVSNWESSRIREAPSAVLTVSSRSRALARASMRFARLVQNN